MLLRNLCIDNYRKGSVGIDCSNNYSLIECIPPGIDSDIEINSISWPEQKMMSELENWKDNICLKWIMILRKHHDDNIKHAYRSNWFKHRPGEYREAAPVGVWIAVWMVPDSKIWSVVAVRSCAAGLFRRFAKTATIVHRRINFSPKVLLTSFCEWKLGHLGSVEGNYANHRICQFWK